MKLVAGPRSHWIVTLVGGFQVDVWADAVTGLTEKTAQDEHIVFGALMDIDADLQGQLQVTVRGPRARCESVRVTNLSTTSRSAPAFANGIARC